MQQIHYNHHYIHPIRNLNSNDRKSTQLRMNHLTQGVSMHVEHRSASDSKSMYGTTIQCTPTDTMQNDFISITQGCHK